MSVCVCGCVCERERESERESVCARARASENIRSATKFRQFTAPVQAAVPATGEKHRGVPGIIIMFKRRN